MSPETAALAAWRELLGRLEAELGRARAGQPLERWHPPVDMPELPAALLPRALALLEGQTELRAAAAAKRDALVRALGRGRRAASTAPGAGPVYLDAVG